MNQWTIYSVCHSTCLRRQLFSIFLLVLRTNGQDSAPHRTDVPTMTMTRLFDVREEELVTRIIHSNNLRRSQVLSGFNKHTVAVLCQTQHGWVNTSIDAGATNVGKCGFGQKRNI